MKDENIKQKRKRGRPRKERNPQMQEQNRALDELQEQEQGSAQAETEEQKSGLLKLNIYRALPFMLPKIKAVALSAIMGKSNSWLADKLKKRVQKVGVSQFVPADLPIVNDGLHRLGEEILDNLIEYTSDRSELNRRVRQLAALVNMRHIYRDVMKKPVQWYADHMTSSSGKSNCCFTELDIMCFNYASRQIANELISLEMVL